MDEDLKYEDLPDEPYVQNESGYALRVVHEHKGNGEFFSGFVSGVFWILLLLLLLGEK